MNKEPKEALSILHNKAPNRIRLSVPLIKYKQTYADMLKQNLLKNPEAKGIYHAEPNIVTGTILIKYHPAMHDEAHILQVLRSVIENLAEGKIEIMEKHKNPRVGKMRPAAFFTRELLVSIGGNVIAGVILALVIAS